LDKICPPGVDPQHAQETYKSTLTQNTGQWIFQNERYKTWLKKPGAFLWIQGKSKFDLSG